MKKLTYIRDTRTLNLRTKVLLGTVSLGLTVVAFSSLTTLNKTKTFVRATTSFRQKASLETKTVGLRFLWLRILLSSIGIGAGAALGVKAIKETGNSVRRWQQKFGG